MTLECLGRPVDDFAHTDESPEQLAVLAEVSVGLMCAVTKPLGTVVTTLPVGWDTPGLTAGPGFELFYQVDYLLPHREAAWVPMEERLLDARRRHNPPHAGPVDVR